MTRRELIRLLGLAPLGAAAASLGPLAKPEPVYGRSPAQDALGEWWPTPTGQASISMTRPMTAEERWLRARADGPTTPALEAWLDEVCQHIERHLERHPEELHRALMQPRRGNDEGT